MMTLLVIVLMLNVSVLLEDNLRNYLTVCSFLFYTQFSVFHSDILHQYCSVVTIFFLFVLFFCCKTCFFGNYHAFINSAEIPWWFPGLSGLQHRISVGV